MPVRHVEFTDRRPSDSQRKLIAVSRLLRWMSCLVVVCVIGSGAIAADPTSSIEPQVNQPDTTENDSGPEERTPASPGPEAQVAEPDPSTESPPVLVPDAVAETASEAEELLDSALAAMDQAVTELEGDAPTLAAVESQQLAVNRLQELLQAASQSQAGQSSSSKNSKSQSSGSPDPSKQKSSQAGASDSSGSGSRRADDENSTESTENVAGPTMPGSGVLAPGARANSVWGHLPAREQEALFRSLSDRFLPEYDAQIRRYYEALAEKK